MFGRITSSRATTTVNVRISVSAVLFPRRRLTTKLQNLLNLTNSAWKSCSRGLYQLPIAA
jgi:hypothetical protein